MAQVSYPGVYIEEFAPAPPIQPASTSTAAFVGFADPMAEDPAPIGVPLRITSFSQFQRRFGTRPVSGFYLWYAVRGFFENGGTDCFVVRASNGKPATWTVKNASGGEIYKISTNKPQTSSGITLTFEDANRLGTRQLKTFAKSFDIAGTRDEIISKKQRELAIVDGHLLRPGDLVKNGQFTSKVVRVIPGRDLTDAPSKNSRVTFDTPFASLDGTDIKPTFDFADLTSKTVVLRFMVEGANAGLTPILDCLSAGSLIELETVHYSIDRVDEEFCNRPAIPDIPATTTTPAILGTPGESTVTYRVTLRESLNVNAPIACGNGKAKVVKLIEKKLKISLTLLAGNGEREYVISPDPVSRYFAPDVMAADSLLKIELTSFDTAAKNLMPNGDPQLENADANVSGKAEDSTQFKTTGADLLSAAISKLTRIPDVNLVAAPDACGLAKFLDKNMVMQAIIAHCETMAERFGVLDAHGHNQEMFELKTDLQTIEEQMGASRSTRGYAALYYPWIRTRPAGGGRVLATVPPSGHVCGLLARVDKSRGVHKAPGNETLNDAVAITQNMTDQEQGILNLQGINVIRTFTSGGRPIVFGARTTASDKNWQYVNVRRLFLFLEESIATALRSSIFEPNNTELWGKLKRVITAFLTKQWQDGALFGNKAEEAFYVKIDDELNPFNEQALGKLNIEIGVRPTYPAEFIVVRIGIWDGGMSVAEA